MIVLVGILVGLIVIFIVLEIYQSIAKKVIEVNEEATNVDSLIGQIGTIESPTDDLVAGTIRIGGAIWRAISDTRLEKDEKAVVVSVEGNKLIVTGNIPD